MRCCMERWTRRQACSFTCPSLCACSSASPRASTPSDAVCMQLVDESKKVVDGDTILTYAFCPLVEHVLAHAHASGLKFRVIVADAHPHLEGKLMLRRLRRHGCKCAYVLLSGLSYVMKDVTKCIIGADGLLSNGAVLGRVGTVRACVRVSLVCRVWRGFR